MFKLIGENNLEDPKTKRILHILAVILMLGFVLASVLVVKKYRAHQFQRKTDAERAALEVSIRKDRELSDKGWVKMIDGEIIGIDSENKKVTVATERIVDYIVKTVEVNEKTQIKLLTEKNKESTENDFYNKDMEKVVNAEYGEEAGNFESIKEGQIAEFFFDQRIDPETADFPVAEKINLYTATEGNNIFEDSNDAN